MPPEFIYTSYKLARHYPPDKTVLENISISFYPGAKIGVIGPDGAGKSALLRIMAALGDISISFYPGAKIGVIGPNGAGKSSLLRIMAGLDDGFTGEARLTPGFMVGYLSQEPELDPAKDVKGNVLDGVRP